MVTTSTPGEALHLGEAARVLRMNLDELVDEVFALRIRTVAAPNGQRLVPREVIEERLGRSSDER